MIGIIYKMTLLTNGKIYIGQHWDISVEHFLSDECEYWGSGSIWLKIISSIKRNNPFDWKKYIHKDILFSSEFCSQKALDSMEKYYIEKYNSLFCNGIGYNLLPGSAYGYKSIHPYQIPYIKEKMIKKLKGRKMPEEVKEKIRKASLGRKMRDEDKKKISIANRGRVSPRKGVKLSDETKRKLSISHLGKHHSDETKKIISEKMRGENHPNYGKHRFKDKNGKIVLI